MPKRAVSNQLLMRAIVAFEKRHVQYDDPAPCIGIG